MVTVDNINPNWAIPDINERFGQLGPITKRYSQWDANGKLTLIDLHYENSEVAKRAIFSMHDTPNDCGGKLKVHFKDHASHR